MARKNRWLSGTAIPVSLCSPEAYPLLCHQCAIGCCVYEGISAHVCFVLGSNFSIVHKTQNADDCVSVRSPSSYTDVRWLAATCHVLDVGNGGLAACRVLGFRQLAIADLTKPIDETRTSQTEPRQGTVPHPAVVVCDVCQASTPSERAIARYEIQSPLSSAN